MLFSMMSSMEPLSALPWSHTTRADIQQELLQRIELLCTPRGCRCCSMEVTLLTLSVPLQTARDKTTLLAAREAILRRNAARHGAPLSYGPATKAKDPLLYFDESQIAESRSNDYSYFHFCHMYTKYLEGYCDIVD